MCAFTSAGLPAANVPTRAVSPVSLIESFCVNSGSSGRRSLTGNVIVHVSVLPGVALFEIEMFSGNETVLPLGTVLDVGANVIDSAGWHVVTCGATVAGRFFRPARIAGVTSAA